MSIRWIHQQVSGEKTSIPMSSLRYQLFLFLCFYVAVQAPYKDGDIVLRGLFGVHQQPDQLLVLNLAPLPINIYIEQCPRTSFLQKLQNVFTNF